MTPLYLASGSPRRRELLAQIGVPFTLVAAPSMKLRYQAKALPIMSSVWPGPRRLQASPRFKALGWCWGRHRRGARWPHPRQARKP